MKRFIGYLLHYYYNVENIILIDFNSNFGLFVHFLIAYYIFLLVLDLNGTWVKPATNDALWISGGKVWKEKEGKFSLLQISKNRQNFECHPYLLFTKNETNNPHESTREHGCIQGSSSSHVTKIIIWQSALVAGQSSRGNRWFAEAGQAMMMMTRPGLVSEIPDFGP